MQNSQLVENMEEKHGIQAEQPGAQPCKPVNKKNKPKENQQLHGQAIHFVILPHSASHEFPQHAGGDHVEKEREDPLEPGHRQGVGDPGT